MISRLSIYPAKIVSRFNILESLDIDAQCVIFRTTATGIFYGVDGQTFEGTGGILKILAPDKYRIRRITVENRFNPSPTFVSEVWISDFDISMT